MNKYKWDYITPEVFFAQIEDLAPFSDWEVDRISEILTDPAYVGSDECEINIYQGELDIEDLIKIKSFTELAIRKGGKGAWVKTGRYDYDEDSMPLVFCQGRDPMKISEIKGKDFRKTILQNRKSAEEGAKQKKLKEERKKQIDKLTAKLQNKQISTDEYLEQIKTFQKD